MTLTRQLNEAIRKFNELATNYNSVVRQLNEARTLLEAQAQPAKPQKI